MRRTGRKLTRKLLSIQAADAPNHFSALFSPSNMNKKLSKPNLLWSCNSMSKFRNALASPSDVSKLNQKRDAKIDEAKRKKTCSKITFDSSCWCTESFFFSSNKNIRNFQLNLLWSCNSMSKSLMFGKWIKRGMLESIPGTEIETKSRNLFRSRFVEYLECILQYILQCFLQFILRCILQTNTFTINILARMTSYPHQNIFRRMKFLYT